MLLIVFVKKLKQICYSSMAVLYAAHCVCSETLNTYGADQLLFHMLLIVFVKNFMVQLNYCFICSSLCLLRTLWCSSIIVLYAPHCVC